MKLGPNTKSLVAFLFKPLYLN